jgi:hypothetical protein
MVTNVVRNAISRERLVDNQIMMIVLALKRLPIQTPIVLTSDQEFIVKLNAAKVPSTNETHCKALFRWLTSDSFSTWIKQVIKDRHHPVTIREEPDAKRLRPLHPSQMQFTCSDKDCMLGQLIASMISLLQLQDWIAYIRSNNQNIQSMLLNE